jgi:hypothetical protein
MISGIILAYWSLSFPKEEFMNTGHRQRAPALTNEK